MKLLIVKLHALGDLVIATPAIKRLREGLPDARIELLTTQWSYPAVQNFPGIDEVIVARNELFFKPGLSTLAETVSLINLIRRRKFNAAVLFHANIRVSQFIGLTGIPTKFRFRSGYDEIDNTILLDENRHSAVTAWELADLSVNKLGGVQTEYPEFDSLNYKWYPDAGELEQAETVLKKHGLEKYKFITVLPGGGVNPADKGEVRRWDFRKFTELVRKLKQQYGIPVVLLGGKTDREVCAAIVGEKNVDALNLSGEFDVRISAALLSFSRLAIANDSGPLHIAAAVGTPVVGIFGPTGAITKLPPGKSSYVAQTNIPCMPCYFVSFAGCIFDRIRCMEELSSEHVMLTVSKALQETEQLNRHEE